MRHRLIILTNIKENFWAFNSGIQNPDRKLITLRSYLVTWASRAKASFSSIFYASSFLNHVSSRFWCSASPSYRTWVLQSHLCYPSLRSCRPISWYRPYLLLPLQLLQLNLFLQIVLDYGVRLNTLPLCRLKVGLMLIHPHSKFFVLQVQIVIVVGVWTHAWVLCDCMHLDNQLLGYFDYSCLSWSTSQPFVAIILSSYCCYCMKAFLIVIYR